MRKCLIRNFIPLVWLDPDGKEYTKKGVVPNMTLKPGTGTWTDFETVGLFHQWGYTTGMSDDNSTVMDSIGLVELEDGRIFETAPMHIKFIDSLITPDEPELTEFEKLYKQVEEKLSAKGIYYFNLTYSASSNRYSSYDKIVPPSYGYGLWGNKIEGFMNATEPAVLLSQLDEKLAEVPDIEPCSEITTSTNEESDYLPF